MDEYSVKVAEIAAKDLQQVFLYISEQLASLQAARRQIERLRDSIARLSTMPYRYNALKDFNWEDRTLRAFMVDNYAVFYTINEAQRAVVVVRVLYGRRDFSKVFHINLLSSTDN